MKSQIKRTISVLLLVCFLVSLTAASASASSQQTNSEKANYEQIITKQTNYG